MGTIVGSCLWSVMMVAVGWRLVGSLMVCWHGVMGENFIDGSLWVRRQGRREMPELSCMDRPDWRGLSGGMDELLEVRAKHCGELGRRYPPLA